MEMLLNILVLLTLLILGYGFGRYAERKHYRHIIAKEQELAHILVFPERIPPPQLAGNHSALVTGSVVISVDYFKRFIAVLRMLIGGRLSSYESLLDRGRREAIIRVKQQAADMNAKAVFNLKLETASISKGQGNTIGSVEILAYGTAMIDQISS